MKLASEIILNCEYRAKFNKKGIKDNALIKVWLCRMGENVCVCIIDVCIHMCVCMHACMYVFIDFKTIVSDILKQNVILYPTKPQNV